MIEPNQIQKKENYMIRFLSSIHSKFQELIENKNERQRKMFDEATTALYEALPIIDGVGKLSMYADWTDTDYVADSFMNIAMKSKDLELRFHEYINEALKILNKKALLFILDDCDVNIEKTFEILETIRLYFTSPQIIVMMTGDANLYGMTVRQNYWKFFKRDFLEKEYSCSPSEESKRAAYRKMVNRLETQYLQKMIKPEHRIFLDNVYEKYCLNRILNEQTPGGKNSTTKYSISIKFSETDGEAKDIKEVYQEIFDRLDLTFQNQVDTDIFVNHLLRQPFRNQFRLLSIYDDFLINTPKKSRDTESAKVELAYRILKVFEVYINLFSADNKHLMARTSIYPAWIMKFLIDNKIVFTGSHLLPNLESDSQSNALLAIAVSCTRQMRSNPSIAFDFWIRVSFIRQVLLVLGEDGKKLNNFAHIYHDSGINKILGNVLAYTNAKLNPESEYAPVNTMAGVGIFEKNICTLSGIKGQLIQLCQLTTVVQNKQETKMFSIYRILVSITEILRIYEEIDKDIKQDSLKKNRINAIQTRLQYLSQIHTFVEPVDVKRRTGSQYNDTIEQPKRDKTHFSNHNMAISIYDWITSYNDVSKITPYCLDRIFIRFYNNLNEISPDGKVENAEIGNYMNKSVLCLWNACIIEDAIVRGELEDITLDNKGYIGEIFISNYKAFLKNDNKKSHNGCFSAWIIKCPLLQCFADPYILYLMDNGEDNASVKLKDYTLYQQKRTIEQILKRNKREIKILNNNINKIIKKLSYINSLNDIERTITLREMEIENNKNSIERKIKANDELKKLEEERLKLIEYKYHDEYELYDQLRTLRENKDKLEEQNKSLRSELKRLNQEMPKDEKENEISSTIHDYISNNNITNVMEELTHTSENQES